MCSYMSFLLQPFITILKEYSESNANDKELWLCVVKTLTQSLLSDEGGERLRFFFDSILC